MYGLERRVRGGEPQNPKPYNKANDPYSLCCFCKLTEKDMGTPAG
jgi:hypothetical protein